MNAILTDKRLIGLTGDDLARMVMQIVGEHKAAGTLKQHQHEPGVCARKANGTHCGCDHVRCDHGWIFHGETKTVMDAEGWDAVAAYQVIEGETPCPVCLPFLAQIWKDTERIVNGQVEIDWQARHNARRGLGFRGKKSDPNQVF